MMADCTREAYQSRVHYPLVRAVPGLFYKASRRRDDDFTHVLSILPLLFNTLRVIGIVRQGDKKIFALFFRPQIELVQYTLYSLPDDYLLPKKIINYKSY